jgi:hypothetical protein
MEILYSEGEEVISPTFYLYFNNLAIIEVLYFYLIRNMMIRKILLLLIISIALGCSKSSSPSESNEVKLLERTRASIDSLLYTIWDKAANSANIVIEQEFDEFKIRAELNSILGAFPQLFEAAYLDSSGTLKYIEPEVFKSSEGIDISSQPHIVKLFETNSRGLSNVFQLVEGKHGVVMLSPVLRAGKGIGAINTVFKPMVLISSLTDNIEQQGIDAFFVIDESGTTIYDTDEMQIGLNVFTDSLFLPFPELQAAALKVTSEESGVTQYSFLDNDKKKIVRKNLWWQTSNYYGTKWKFCIIKERV